MAHSNRRSFLKSTLIAPYSTTFWDAAKAVTRQKLPVAAIVTEYRDNSHADVIIGKILNGFQQDGGPGPNLQLASLFTDQIPENDTSRMLARTNGFPIVNSIDEALTLGTDEIKVAGVLSIGEHGKYPFTLRTNQHMYPRRRFFDQITATFRRCGSSVPVFNDKHFSYYWRDAQAMINIARKIDFPVMAGSSLPLTFRRPAIDLPLGIEIENALTLGYGGYESYGFHALETHQCLLERRCGGETGVKAVQAVRGKAIWEAEAEDRWSWTLMEAALDAIPDVPGGKWKNNLKEDAAWYLLEHRDGLHTAVAMANGVAQHFVVALKIRGQNAPLVQWFELQDVKPYIHFAYLLKAIEYMFQTGKPAYSAKRTLLTTGILDRLMHSLASGGKRLATPELSIQYKAGTWPFANHPDTPLDFSL